MQYGHVKFGEWMCVCILTHPISSPRHFEIMEWLAKKAEQAAVNVVICLAVQFGMFLFHRCAARTPILKKSGTINWFNESREAKRREENDTEKRKTHQPPWSIKRYSGLFFCGVGQCSEVEWAPQQDMHQFVVGHFAAMGSQYQCLRIES